VIRSIREALRWKFVFYELLLPALRRLGPSGYDASLCALGRVWAMIWPARRARLVRALRHVQEALDLDGPIEPLWLVLAANSARFLARDYALDVASDTAVFGRFRVHGEDHLRCALSLGRGAILVGSHMGAHIAGLHWLFRSDLPVRALIQRPRHVSRELAGRFDAARGPHSQADVFLRRDLPASARVERLIRARAALLDGVAIYLSGDIPWRGPNTQPGCLLGQPQRFLSIWIELAVLTRAPVFHVFCTHQPEGKFALEFETVGQVRPGEEGDALADYLKALEARIATFPTQAVAHLLWPCFNPAAEGCAIPIESNLCVPPRASHRNLVPTTTGKNN
jgi:lauroyl/myristoyl acyltransferase